MSSTGTISGKVIIPKESWRIRSTGTGQTCSTASQKGSVFQASHWGDLKKDPSIDKRTELIDNADRVEVERAFSLSKRSFGMGLIRTRPEETTQSSIALSIIAMNIDKLAKAFLCQKTVLEFSRYNCGTKAGILLFIPHNHWDYRKAA